MEKNCKDLDKIRAIIRRTIAWASGLDVVPLAYIDEDRTRVATSRRTYLEFGLQSWGSETDIRVGPHHRRSIPGTLVVMNAHFGNRGTPRHGWRFWCLSFDVGLSSPIRDIGHSPLLCTTRLRNPADIGERFALVALERLRTGEAANSRIKGGVLLLLGDLLEDLQPVREYPREQTPAVRDALEYMRTQYRDPGLTLASLAEKIHLSEAHFGRIFRRETGMAPMKYLGTLRLARARELLQRTQLQIAEIADDVGYRDPAYFSRLFHRQTGMAPKAFRRTPR